MFIFKALELMKEFGNSKFAGAIVILLGEVIFTGLPEKLDELMVGDGHSPSNYIDSISLNMIFMDLITNQKIHGKLRKNLQRN